MPKFLITILFLFSCGKPTQEKASQNGWESYEDFEDYTFEDDLEVDPNNPTQVYRVQPKLSGLTRKVHQTEIKLCVSDRTKSKPRLEMIQRSCQTWVNGLKNVSKKPLAVCKALETREKGCDGFVQVGNYSPAMTQMGNNPIVMINFGGWFGSETVTLHEFGHAFGLLDTYSGRGGSCQRGQPNSVMCRASYLSLQPDDVQGIETIYKAINNL